METNSDPVVVGCTLLPVPCPKRLFALLDRDDYSRYLGLCGTGVDTAQWTTGWTQGECPARAVLRPLLTHPTLELSLRQFEVWATTGLPSHALLADRRTPQWYVGSYASVQAFLQTHNQPSPTSPTAASPFADVREFYALGANLAEFLDGLVDTELLKAYLDQSRRAECPHCQALVTCIEKWRRNRRR